MEILVDILSIEYEDILRDMHNYPILQNRYQN